MWWYHFSTSHIHRKCIILAKFICLASRPGRYSQQPLVKYCLHTWLCRLDHILLRCLFVFTQNFEIVTTRPNLVAPLETNIEICCGLYDIFLWHHLKFWFCSEWSAQVQNQNRFQEFYYLYMTSIWLQIGKLRLRFILHVCIRRTYRCHSM